MHLSPAQPAEFPTLIALVNLAYRGDETTTSWSTEARDIAGPRLTLESLTADLAAQPAAHFLAARLAPGSAIVGTVWIEPDSDNTNDDANGTWYIGLLTIDPELQSQQLGRRLLADAEAFAAQHGARRIRMTVVNTRDTLIAWYRRRGYTLTGETEPYATDALTGRPKREGLHFLVMEKLL